MTTTCSTHVATSPHETIVKMANQIAVAFQSAPDPAVATADHIAAFWDPRMRAQLRSALAEGGADLHPVARAAAMRLEDPA